MRRELKFCRQSEENVGNTGELAHLEGSTAVVFRRKGGHVMRRRIVQLLVGCLSLLLLFVVFDWLFLSPYYPYSWEPKVPPAVVSRSEPNREGLITAARPLVTQIAPGEPLGVAIHWQRPDDALRIDDKIFYSRNAMFLPRTTMNSVTFTLTSPDGTVSHGRVDFRPDRVDESMHFARMPGLVFEINSDGLELLAPKLSSAWRLRSAWQSGKSFQFAKPGVYRLGVSGQIVCYDAARMEFASKPIEFEVLPGIKTAAALRDRAKYVIATRWQRRKLWEDDIIVADDADGNRHFAFDGVKEGDALGWKAAFVFRPDGALLQARPRIGSRCIAVGTLVETPRGSVPIESIRPGDRVVSFDLDSKQRLESTVLHAVRSRAYSTIRFGNSLRTTAEHPIWANGVWKRADEVKTGDTVESNSGPLKFASIKHLNGAIDVIDLDVDAPHNYFAGGILVHNKSVEPPPRNQDWWYKLPGVPAPPRD